MDFGNKEHPIDAAVRLLDLAVAIQQIPAPTFAEEKRAAFIYEGFQSEGLRDVTIDASGNVIARIPGLAKNGAARPVVVSAHMDTVFPDSMNLQIRRQPGRIYGPGIGDNSLGVAGLFGLLWAVRQAEGSALPGDIWLAANVGEEGLGDLRGMRAIVDRFGERPRAYIILEGMSLGQIYHRALCVQRYRITVHTPGGHSWVDYGRPSAIHELAALANRLTFLPVSEQPRASMNIGIIAGGISINTIASEAHLELDLRSENARTLADMTRQVKSLVQAVGKGNVRVDIDLIGERPTGKLSATDPLVRLAQRCLEEQGILPILNIGSTDANIPLSRGYPAICIGLTYGQGAHTSDEHILTQPLTQGLAQLVKLVEGVFREL